MHPIKVIVGPMQGFVSGFLSDVWKLPVVFRLALGWMVLGGAWQWWKRRQQAELLAASVHWPVFRARVVAAQVIDRRRGEDSRQPWEGVLTYSYTVPGHGLEVGEFRRRFLEQAEAEEWASALRDTSVDVRVDAADPKRSVWQETPVVTPAVPELFSNPEPSLWRLPALVVLCLSVAGAVTAACIQVGGLLGRPMMTVGRDGAAFALMHVGAIVCAGGSAMIASRRKRSGRGLRRDLFERGSGATRLMQGLGTYCVLVFLYGWVRSGAHPGAAGDWTVPMFSSLWLLFYTTAAAGCWRVMQSGAAG